MTKILKSYFPSPIIKNLHYRASKFRIFIKNLHYRASKFRIFTSYDYHCTHQVQIVQNTHLIIVGSFNSSDGNSSGRKASSYGHKLLIKNHVSKSSANHVSYPLYFFHKIVKCFTRMVNCFFFKTSWICNIWLKVWKCVLHLWKNKGNLKQFIVEFGKEFGHEFGKTLNDKKILKLKKKSTKDMKKINALIYVLVVSWFLFAVVYHYM